MIDELHGSLKQYEQKWQRLLADRKDKDFFFGLKPTAVAWKVVDIDDFNRRFMELRDHCDQIHYGWVNDRWLVTLHLKDIVLPWKIEIVKLFQRRPGSTDATGLDHVDFLVPTGDDAKATVTDEAIQWTEEMNGAHCKWISVWFEGT